MRRYEEFEFCLDGCKFAVKLREIKRWKQALCIVANTLGILAILAGSWLLAHGYKDSAVYLAVAGFGALTVAKG
jgi:hypothetical protein